ncbi:VOC family protein [Amycolatopsis sp.]|jgi:catechol 2,3-dioxygenase-like lactoylglutathione lyase family enzyme|uniref:VOC family protein n=1 Tax=Amycolatopsis sp. TaxID=37632 RepID=UPI002E0762E6|nr:VOC family protein [Amycolatopsis sp.]
MPTSRELLEQYVQSGKLMQLATLGADYSPVVCNVWYDAHFAPDLLRFISRHDRNHSANIRKDPRVAGSIIAIPLEALGQPVAGVTFTGMAKELSTTGVESEVDAFVKRWPAATGAIDPAKLARGETPTRIYEVAVEEWVLFDEINFPEQPRQVIQATRVRWRLAPNRSESVIRFRVHHVAISVRDMQESIRFYETFGFRQVIHYADPNGDFEISHLKLDTGFLELWWYKDQVAAPESAAELSSDLPRIGVKHLALRVESVDEAKRLVEELGIPLAVQRRDGNTGVAYFFIRDPSGNLLEILEDDRSL